MMDDDGGWWMIMADADGDDDDEDDDDDDDDDDDGVVVGDDDAWNQYWWNLLSDGSLTPAHAPPGMFFWRHCLGWILTMLGVVVKTLALNGPYVRLDIETTCFLTIFWSDPEGLDPAYVELAFPIPLQGIP